MGFQRVFHLNYGNHQMDGISRPELRGCSIFLFRLLQVDTIVGYDPSGHYEENPGAGAEDEIGARKILLRARPEAREPRAAPNSAANSRKRSCASRCSEFVLKADREMGKKYGVEYAEAFHYIGPETSAVDAYVKQHAVPR